MMPILRIGRKLLCWLGFHKLRYASTYAALGIEIHRCQRCQTAFVIHYRKEEAA
jgi:hypothetical protein